MQLGVVLVQRFTEDRVGTADQLFREQSAAWRQRVGTVHNIKLQYLPGRTKTWRRSGRHIGLERDEKLVDRHLWIDEVVVIRPPPFHVDDRARELVAEVVGHEPARIV